MVNFRKGFVYTIVYTTSVKEVQRDYQNAKIILLQDDGEYKLVCIEERR